MKPQQPIDAEQVSQWTIQSPCKMDWDLMTGDDQVRFCDHCQKNVYNITQMSQQETVDLVNENEGRICVRMFRRADGTIVTSQCPPLREHSEISTSRNHLQFSLSMLLVLLTASAGLCAAAPWIGKKLQPLVDRMFPDCAVEPELIMGDYLPPSQIVGKVKPVVTTTK